MKNTILLLHHMCHLAIVALMHRTYAMPSSSTYIHEQWNCNVCFHFNFCLYNYNKKLNVTVFCVVIRVWWAWQWWGWKWGVWKATGMWLRSISCRIYAWVQAWHHGLHEAHHHILHPLLMPPLLFTPIDVPPIPLQGGSSSFPSLPSLYQLAPQA